MRRERRKSPPGKRRRVNKIFVHHIKQEEEVIIVDRSDNEIGAGEKIKVHLEGKLHRALSVFIFNADDELLLQKRVLDKYHSGGLWSNTCCSHPSPGEPIEKAAHRRLKEEMGFDCDLKEVFSFIYHVKFDNDITEHEFDHVFIGKFDEPPEPNPEEVSDWKWVGLEELKQDIKRNPANYTYWLRESIDKIDL